MGVDEIYRGKKDKFLTVVCNLETAEPLWFRKERRKETLDEYFRTQLVSRQRKRIEAACVDMWEPFRFEHRADCRASVAEIVLLTATPLQHVACSLLCRLEKTCEIGRDHPLEGLGSVLDKGLRHEDARVIDEHITHPDRCSVLWIRFRAVDASLTSLPTQSGDVLAPVAILIGPPLVRH
jgi:hypothetical protein